MVTKELISYVNQQIGEGKTRDQIRLGLIQTGGWRTEDIEEVFMGLGSMTPQSRKKVGSRSWLLSGGIFIIIGLLPFFVLLIAGFGLVLFFVSIFFGGMRESIVGQIGGFLLMSIKSFEIIGFKTIGIGMVVSIALGIILLIVNKRKRNTI
ncbi:MAG: hypothetical protein KBB91_00790 [Candidatus Pacebacteria bacterium]|nr:hypothetical protein [Candidatus Paceibacterota bacterium]MBP9700943.1 hypothetical protein [Candidatus Paceibacterota bacterium]